ncbi:hypothetical protein BMS3Bbin15_00570 [archaeon BMS3Bbin15]|nr:hypothetical protein BMS3Bbin15_00570 [archaeon BMS3Bbin15]
MDELKVVGMECENYRMPFEDKLDYLRSKDIRFGIKYRDGNYIFDVSPEGEDVHLINNGRVGL